MIFDTIIQKLMYLTQLKLLTDGNYQSMSSPWIGVMTGKWPEPKIFTFLPKFIQETFLDIYIMPPFLKFYDEGLYYFELSISLLSGITEWVCSSYWLRLI